ncbi:MAG: hypothetical protein AB3N23_01885 [Paracoccaceae bacterium]
MVNESPNANDKIVSKFDSATQILRRDQLEMRINLVVDQDTRRGLEERFLNLKNRTPENDPVMTKAEAAYVDRHLKPEPDLKLEMDYAGYDYEHTVELLKHDFHGTAEASQLKDRFHERKENDLRTLERDTDQTLQREKENGITREEFFKNRNGITSHQFKRAVGRGR